MSDKKLSIVEHKEQKTEYNIFKYNFIDAFSLLEELTISTIKLTVFEEIDTIKKNVQKLELLHTIKLINSINNEIDISGLLEAKNLKYLKLTGSTIKIADLPIFSKKIKASSIQKLTLKNNLYISADNDQITYFKQFIKAISCQSLKTLKIQTEFCPSFVHIIFCKLSLFENLELICFYVQGDFELYKKAIKKLISIVQSRSTKLSKFKVHKYIWDIRNLQTKGIIEIARSQFSPADLWILAVLCENKVFHSVKCIDLSDNIGIIDCKFVERMVRIIKAIKCYKVIIKNSE